MDEPASSVAAPAPSGAPSPASVLGAAPAPVASPPLPASVLGAAVSTPDPWSTVPDKYRVTAADGSLDQGATFAKVRDAHQAAEARIGAGDIRPKTADDYSFSPPEAVKDAFDPKDANFTAFRQKAHEAGFTQKQLDIAMGAYFESVSKLAGGLVALDETAATTELQKVWTTPDAFRQNAGAAFRATQQFGGDLAAQLEQRYGNDPLFLQFAARVGAQLREDSSAGLAAASGGASSVEALMASEAYRNSRHPEHAAVTAKVSAHFAAQPGASSPIT